MGERKTETAVWVNRQVYGLGSMWVLDGKPGRKDAHQYLRDSGTMLWAVDHPKGTRVIVTVEVELHEEDS